MSAVTATAPPTAAEQRRAYIRTLVDQAPPLTEEQRTALRLLLAPVRKHAT